MFRASNLLLLNKCDLLPHLAFDVQLALANARRIHPKLPTLQISATTGIGLGPWIEWIEARLAERAVHR
jgi:hydrogenase nickel incorporation protein HypB